MKLKSLNEADCPDYTKDVEIPVDVRIPHEENRNGLQLAHKIATKIRDMLFPSHLLRILLRFMIYLVILSGGIQTRLHQ